MKLAGKRGRPPTFAPPPPNKELKNEDNIISFNKYKNLSFVTEKKHYPCQCWSCHLVGIKLITEQFSKLQNLLIQDNDPQILTIFGKEMVI